jgi:hypothetical protein
VALVCAADFFRTARSFSTREAITKLEHHATEGQGKGKPAGLEDSPCATGAYGSQNRFCRGIMRPVDGGPPK